MLSGLKERVVLDPVDDGYTTPEPVPSVPDDDPAEDVIEKQDDGTNPEEDDTEPPVITVVEPVEVEVAEQEEKPNLVKAAILSPITFLEQAVVAMNQTEGSLWRKMFFFGKFVLLILLSISGAFATRHLYYGIGIISYEKYLILTLTFLFVAVTAFMSIGLLWSFAYLRIDSITKEHLKGVMLEKAIKDDDREDELVRQEVVADAFYLHIYEKESSFDKDIHEVWGVDIDDDHSLYMLKFYLPYTDEQSQEVIDTMGLKKAKSNRASSAKKSKDSGNGDEENDDHKGPASPEEKKRWFGGWGGGTKEVVKVTTEKDLGIDKMDSIYLIAENGKAQELRGDAFPAGEEFLIAETERSEEDGGDVWVLYRKKLNKKAGTEEVTEHFKVDLKQLLAVTMMTEAWNDDGPKASIIKSKESE